VKLNDQTKLQTVSNTLDADGRVTGTTKYESVKAQDDLLVLQGMISFTKEAYAQYEAEKQRRIEVMQETATLAKGIKSTMTDMQDYCAAKRPDIAATAGAIANMAKTLQESAQSWLKGKKAATA
jgi:hypothetical protein